MTEQGPASRLFNSHLNAQTQLRILAAHLARALLRRDTLRCQRAQGRPGAGRAPTVHCAKGGNKNLHSGIQVKPNTRPSLRSGLTAYAEFSPGSDALLPPSPCGSPMRVPGRAATSPQDLAHRPRAPGRHGFAVRRSHRSCARRPSLTVARPAMPIAPM
jgi:hypothetical protein